MHIPILHHSPHFYNIPHKNKEFPGPYFRTARGKPYITSSIPHPDPQSPTTSPYPRKGSAPSPDRFDFGHYRSGNALEICKLQLIDADLEKV